METTAPLSLRVAFAQQFTADLITHAGIGPGMRVLVAGADNGELAFLVAERVGASGAVVGIDRNVERLAHARCGTHEQRFAHVTFAPGALGDVLDNVSYDAVVGRFFLLNERDPVASIRQATALVHAGGRVAFVEWHWESVRWRHASAWPPGRLYGAVAQWTIDGLRLGGTHVDMGLRLVNAFVEAGLLLPAVRTELRAVGNGATHGYDFFAEALAEVLPALQRRGIATESQVDVATLGARLRAESAASGGHAFLPLLVGAFAKRPA